MALDTTKAREWTSRLLCSRLRILADHGFYGLLLSHLSFAIDESIDTASTDARKIYFSPNFLDELSDDELDFVLMHEVMHVVLQHCLRGLDYDQFLFNVACDIVVNSNILKSCGNNLRKITLRCEGQPAMHLAPDGKEGHLYSAEEVYEMLIASAKKRGKKQGGKGNGSKNGKGNGSGDGNDNENKNDSDNSSSNGGGSGSDKKKNGKGGSGNSKSDGEYTLVDSHDKWQVGDDAELRDRWASFFEDALKVISVTEASTECGSLPAFAERILAERRKPQVNWREALHNFVQEEINDYSFSPPDRRFDGSGFFLPDFNEKDELVRDILFMIDTSGSMTDAMIGAAYNEIRGAIEQFSGKLEGHLGFFDAVAVPAKPFSSIKELEIIRPYGGGGTNFHCVLDYALSMDPNPVSIIILTDGYAPFPKESMAQGIPVLWIINNEDVTPPWGKVTRISVE